MRTVRDNSALTRSQEYHQLKQALTLTVHHLSSLFRICHRRSSCIQRLRTFLCERAKGFVGKTEDGSESA
jgi:hypothetical protein